MEFLLQLQQLGIGVRGAESSGQAVFWNEFSCNWEIAFCSFERLAEWMWIFSIFLYLFVKEASLQHVPVWAWPWYIRQHIAFAVRAGLQGFYLSISARNQSISSSGGITNSAKLAQLDKKTFRILQHICQKVQLMSRGKFLVSSVFPSPLRRDTRSSSVK